MPSVQFSSIQLLSRVRLFATPWTVAHQVSRSPPKPMSIVSVMPSNYLILCCPLLLPPSIFPNIRVFSNELLSFKLSPVFLWNKTDEQGQPTGSNSGLRSGMKITDFFQSYFPFDVPLIQPTCRTFWRPWNLMANAVSVLGRFHQVPEASGTSECNSLLCGIRLWAMTVLKWLIYKIIPSCPSLLCLHHIFTVIEIKDEHGRYMSHEDI